MNAKVTIVSILKIRKVFYGIMLGLGVSLIVFSSTHFSKAHPKITLLTILMHILVMFAVYFFYWKPKTNSIFNQIIKDIQ